jgi:predicted TIM-barrel fold metal-dependent hydrolase
MRQVFALADRLRVPVLVHMRARGGSNYGPEDAHLFLERLLPIAPDVDVIVAHFAGGGDYSDELDQVMSVFADAAQRHDPATKDLYFDVSGVVTEEATPHLCALIAERIRQIGPTHILYGSDTSPPGGSIKAGWEIFRSKVPLTPGELQTIAQNRLSFIR